MSRSRPQLMIFSGNSHPDLAKKICHHIGVKLSRCDIRLNSARESEVNIFESVRGKDVYLIQTGTDDVNNNLMDLLVMCYVCKTASARSIVGVVPYLPYSKQSKRRKRGSITCRLMAKLLEKAGLSHLITMDLHAKEIQGFFDIPVDNLRASGFLISHIQNEINDYRNATVVAGSAEYAKRATGFSERLSLPIAVIHGEAKMSTYKNIEDDHVDDDHVNGEDEEDHHDDKNNNNNEKNGNNDGVDLSSENMNGNNVDALVKGKKGRKPLITTTTTTINSAINTMTTMNNNLDISKNRNNSQSIPSSSKSFHKASSDTFGNRVMQMSVLPMMKKKEKPPLSVVGDVNGRIAFIIEDMIDDIVHLDHIGHCLKAHGAYKVYAIATHGLLYKESLEYLQSFDCSIDEVIITNTIPQNAQRIKSRKIRTVEISLLFAEAIRRIHNGESMSYLFKDVSLED
ncbi:hypothetical protein SNEBB_010443 [Seison nebaliae]|nr:hypothetical protein SNEBB_010443 [Seison nebaliae]